MRLLPIRSHVRLATTFALAAVSASAGCASYFTAGVRSDEKPDAASAYLYGRFQTGGSSGVPMGLLINCSDGATYKIGFSNDATPRVIKINPARCALDDVVFLDGGFEPHRIHPPDTWSRYQVFPAGRAYYLGDFFGKEERNRSLTSDISSTQLTGFDDSYERTTIDFKRTFAHLRSLPTEDRMLVPKDAR